MCSHTVHITSLCVWSCIFQAKLRICLTPHWLYSTVIFCIWFHPLAIVQKFSSIGTFKGSLLTKAWPQPIPTWSWKDSQFIAYDFICGHLEGALKLIQLDCVYRMYKEKQWPTVPISTGMRTKWYYRKYELWKELEMTDAEKKRRRAVVEQTWLRCENGMGLLRLCERGQEAMEERV